MTFWEKGVKHEVKSCVCVAWQSDERFTMPGDSGSVYYAVRGCFRYPIAVHRASVVIKGYSDDRIELEGGRFEKLQIHSRISIATPLALCLDEYSEHFNRREISIMNEAEEDEAEDTFTLPVWFDRVDLSPSQLNSSTLISDSGSQLGTYVDDIVLDVPSQLTSSMAISCSNLPKSTIVDGTRVESTGDL